MFPRSLILLASTGAAVAQLAPECEFVANVAALLQADDGEVYCSSILNIGTVTDTIVESATATDTTTITIPGEEVTLSVTTTETSTVVAGTVTETAPEVTATSTVFERSTVYSCSTQFIRRGLSAQSTSCTNSKTTPTPTPTPSSTSCTKSKSSQQATSVYNASQPPASTAQAGYYAPGSSQAAYSSLPGHGGSLAPESTSKGYSATSLQYGQESSSASYSASTPDVYSSVYNAAYPEASSQYYSASSLEASSEYTSGTYPLTSSVYEHITSSMELPTPSSYAEYPEESIYSSIYYSSVSVSTSEEVYTPSSSASSSEVVSTSEEVYTPSSSSLETVTSSEIVSTSETPSASTSSSLEIVSSSETSSEIDTPSPTPTPTPAPAPSCDTAPTVVRTFGCDAVSTACGCMGLAPATVHVTSTMTIAEAAYITETLFPTTTVELTEIVFTTVPAATETFAPTVTVTTTASATATVCPCSGSASTLCGLTPDTCKDLQNDPNNCGSCGNVCSSGSCGAGKCNPCAPRKCGTFGLGSCTSGTTCYCVTGSVGTLSCANIGAGDCASYATCDVDSDCGTGKICSRDTCCRSAGGRGICLQTDLCGNAASTKRMFTPRGKNMMGGNEVLGRF